MFAEELACHSGRKKAEQNRARRKLIQQQQQQQKQKQVEKVHQHQQQQQQQEKQQQKQDDVGQNKEVTNVLTTSENVNNDNISSTMDPATRSSFDNSSSVITGKEEEGETIESSSSLSHAMNTSSNNTSHINNTNAVGEEVIATGSALPMEDTTGNFSNMTSDTIPSSVTATTMTNSTATATTILTGASVSTTAMAVSMNHQQQKQQVSAVERAKHERHLRTVRNLYQTNAIRIQSWYRMVRSYKSTYQTITKQLQSQLSDLDTLRTIIVDKKSKQQGNSNNINNTNENYQTQPWSLFVPPHATSTSLVRMLLFVCFSTSSIKRRRKCTDGRANNTTTMTTIPLMEQSFQITSEQILFLYRIIDLCLLPGLLSSAAKNGDSMNASASHSNEKNAVLLWIRNNNDPVPVGMYRFQRLIRLISIAVIHPSTPTIASVATQRPQHQPQHHCLDTILQFVSNMVGNTINCKNNNDIHYNEDDDSGGRSLIQKICRSIVFPIHTSTNNDHNNKYTKTATNTDESSSRSINKIATSFATPFEDTLSYSAVWPMPPNVIQTSSVSSALPTMSLSPSSFSYKDKIIIHEGEDARNGTCATTAMDTDWFQLVRHYLLFYQRQSPPSTRITANHATSTNSSNTSTSSERYRPIPHNCDRDRENCFSPSERYRANRLVHFLLQATSSLVTSSQSKSVNNNATILHENVLLQAKFVTHILTIPILTWRIHYIMEPIPVTISSPTKVFSTMESAIVLLVRSSSLTSSTQNSRRQQPQLIELLQSFLKVYSNSLNCIHTAATILPTADVPLTVCPATPAQCLLGNLVQLGRLCPALDPQNVHSSFSYTATALFFDVISALIYEIVPIGTFVTKETSAVEWIDDGRGHSKPIIVSNVVLEHCRGVIVDSFVRKLFVRAMMVDYDTTTITNSNNDSDCKTISSIDQILNNKNDKDIKLEQDMYGVGDTSAASLAAKEARVDRNTNFWNTSKWATKLTKGMSNLLNTATTTVSSNKNSSNSSSNSSRTATTSGNLLNTSSMSRDLAEGKREAGREAHTSFPQQQYTQPSEPFTLDLLLSLCRTYSIFLSRWGGAGSFDVVHGGTTSIARSGSSDNTIPTATSRAEPFTMSLLNVLCFSTPIVRTLWALIQQTHEVQKSSRSDMNNNRDNTILSDILAIIDTNHGNVPVHAQTIRPVFNLPTIAKDTTTSRRQLQQLQQQPPSQKRVVSNNDGAAVLYLFLCTFAHVLIITDDVEIHDMDKPLPMHQIRRCILVLKKLLYRAACADDVCDTANSMMLAQPNYFGYSLISAASRTMKDLYDRSSRRPFCLPSMWTIPNLLDKEVARCKSCKDYLDLLASTPVLRVCPFLVAFKGRLKLFERIITTNRIEMQGENSANPFHTNPLKPGIPIRITRGRILEDGLITMNNLGPTMLRQRIQVHYYNEAGLRETGIDAGGLFKDFWTDLCAIAFNPNYALFRVTEAGAAGNCLYPNPLSGTVHGSTDHIILFEFLGRILGKALYEGITINPRFAHFFLSFLRGDYNFLHMLPDLSTIDPQLYNNLMFLKNYDGDCSDLCLTFTVTTDEFGGTKETPLIPNGGNVDVTNDNKQRYIGLVAKYYVFDQVKEQSEAFKRGLWDVLDKSWLQLFNEPELQVLISGVAEGKLDIDDMKANVQYAGGYSSVDGTIRRFWSVVGTMTTKQQSQLLRFVTGCERPPPLGFGSLNPPFTIQRVATGGSLLRGEGDRLPTASTCFNILKLPCYGSEKVLKERLTYAIESGAGFELS